MTRLQCSSCRTSMPALAWRCSACGSRNLLYTRGQWVVAILLGAMILVFVGKR